MEHVDRRHDEHPLPWDSLASFTALIHKHHMYIFGGVSGFMESITDTSGAIPLTGTWKPKSSSRPMPTGRFNHGAEYTGEALLGLLFLEPTKRNPGIYIRNTVHMIVLVARISSVARFQWHHQCMVRYAYR